MNLDLSDDIINVSDITERFAELRDERADLESDITDAAEALENAKLARDDLTGEEPDAETDAAQSAVTDAESDAEAAREALDEWEEENREEFDTLSGIVDELRGDGGDHQFEGDWFPGYLIRETHFTDYAQQFAEDIGAIPGDAAWPCTCIDWEEAARELRHDYSETDINGTSYLYR
jgi:hypothetical protein